MKIKLFNALLIITSLAGYLEWGENNHTFLILAEAEIFSKLVTEPASVLHPFTILPIAGQVLLMVTLFQKKPAKILTYTGIGCLGILLGFMFVIGLLSFNFKITVSVIPFIATAVLAIKESRNKKKV